MSPASDHPVSDHALTLDAARGLLAEVVEDIRRLVAVESPSDDLAALERSAAAVAELIDERLGVAAERVDRDGVPHLRVRWGDGPRTVLLLGHHDTVWPIGTIERLPWSHRDGVLRGPGSFDMKTGLVMAIHALAALQSADPALLDGVTLLVTGDEELGSPTSRALIEEEAAGCSAALVLEATGDRGVLKTGRKGVSTYQVEIDGLAAHAGLEPEAGSNATVELAHQVLAIAALNAPERGTTVTPTVVRAGTARNTVPAAGSIQIDVRCTSPDEQHRIDEELHGLRPAVEGCGLRVLGGVNRPPLEPAMALPLFARAAGIAEALGLPRLEHASVGGASDGNFTAGLGVPTLDGLGAVGGGAHSDTEHVESDRVPERLALLGALVSDLQRRSTAGT